VEVPLLKCRRRAAWFGDPGALIKIRSEFNGILPIEAREKARAAKDHFDNLYLIVDQQYRWKSVLLPDPRPRVLDPLLVGELKQILLDPPV